MSEFTHVVVIAVRVVAVNDDDATELAAKLRDDLLAASTLDGRAEIEVEVRSIE